MVEQSKGSKDPSLDWDELLKEFEERRNLDFLETPLEEIVVRLVDFLEKPSEALVEPLDAITELSEAIAKADSQSEALDLDSPLEALEELDLP